MLETVVCVTRLILERIKCRPRPNWAQTILKTNLLYCYGLLASESCAKNDFVKC